MTELEQLIIQTIGDYLDEVKLNGDPNSFVEMDQQVIHIASDKFGEHYYKVTISKTDASEYFKPVFT